MLQPEVLHNFEQIANFLFVPTNEEELDQLVELLDEITDIVRDDENHPLANFMDVLGALIETYESEHLPEPDSDPISMLRYLLEEYHLEPKDFPELGNQREISEILNGERALSVQQIRLLSERFHVPVSVFI